MGIGGAHTNFKLVTLRSYDYRYLTYHHEQELFREALHLDGHHRSAIWQSKQHTAWSPEPGCRILAVANVYRGGISERWDVSIITITGSSPIGSASARSSSIGGSARDQVRNLSVSFPG
jgi:hypothetical protein